MCDRLKILEEQNKELRGMFDEKLMECSDEKQVMLCRQNDTMRREVRNSALLLDQSM